MNKRSGSDDSEPGFTGQGLPETIAACSIAIIGLGLMGGSLAMALKGKCASLVGVDPDAQVIASALEKKIIDRGATDGLQALSGIDMVILAAPVLKIIEWVRLLPRYLAGPLVVLDVGSTKRRILDAMNELPAGFEPVGGHPMCGKERLTLGNADPAMFVGATFAIVPLPRTTRRAQALALQVAQMVGSVPLWVDADTHDRWTAATSHFPYLLSNALAYGTPIEAASLIGSGFRSTARLAATPVGMMQDVLATNRDYILNSIHHLRYHLGVIEDCLEKESYVQLAELLVQGSDKYERLIAQSRFMKENRQAGDGSDTLRSDHQAS